jgi:plastocyanin
MTRRLSCMLVIAVAGLIVVPAGAAAGGMCHPAAGLEPTSSPKTTVVIDDCAFEQTVTYVDPGDTVRWVNRDVYPHSVTGAALSWGTADLLDRKDAVSYRFDDEGVYPYYCDLHPSMVGAVVVGDGKAVGTGAGVSEADTTSAAATGRTTPVDGDGGSSLVPALSIAAVLAALFVVMRFALGRRAGATTAS